MPNVALDQDAMMLDVVIKLERRCNLGEMLIQLREYGFVPTELLETVHVLFGYCPPSALKKLSSIEGVISIGENRKIYKTM